MKVTLEPDRELKTIEVPAEMKRALAQSEAARTAFERLAPSRRREHIQHVTEAKKPGTRQRRIEKMAEILLNRP